MGNPKFHLESEELVELVTAVTASDVPNLDINDRDFAYQLTSQAFNEIADLVGSSRLKGIAICMPARRVSYDDLILFTHRAVQNGLQYLKISTSAGQNFDLV